MCRKSGKLTLMEWLYREGDVNILLSWERVSEICQFAECLVDFLQDVNIVPCVTEVFSLLIRHESAIYCSVIRIMAWSMVLILVLLGHSVLSLCCGGLRFFEVWASSHCCIPPWLKQPIRLLHKITTQSIPDLLLCYPIWQPLLFLWQRGFDSTRLWTVDEDDVLLNPKITIELN